MENTGPFVRAAAARDTMKAVARRTPSEKSALSAIERHGALLVYPLANRADPPSLWSVLYPGVAMRWAWDESADQRVVDLWQLREQLARSRKVVYGKWYKGRAVFFSHTLFEAMLRSVRPQRSQLSLEAEELLKLLEDDSPQSTKRLRAEAGLSGKQSEGLWNRSLRELWEKLLIVGVGEVDDGAFPSLAVGATRLIFEDLWERARSAPASAQDAACIACAMPEGRGFSKHWHKTLT